VKQFNIVVTIAPRREERKNSSRQDAKSQSGAKHKSLLFFANFAHFATLRETVFLIVAARCLCHFRQRNSLNVIMHINKTLLLGRSARGG
jgi:hypothetical protein